MRRRLATWPRLLIPLWFLSPSLVLFSAWHITLTGIIATSDTVASGDSRGTTASAAVTDADNVHLRVSVEESKLRRVPAYLPHLSHIELINTHPTDPIRIQSIIATEDTPHHHHHHRPHLPHLHHHSHHHPTPKNKKVPFIEIAEELFPQTIQAGQVVRVPMNFLPLVHSSPPSSPPPPSTSSSQQNSVSLTPDDVKHYEVTLKIRTSRGTARTFFRATSLESNVYNLSSLRFGINPRKCDYDDDGNGASSLSSCDVPSTESDGNNDTFEKSRSLYLTNPSTDHHLQIIEVFASDPEWIRIEYSSTIGRDGPTSIPPGERSYVARVYVDYRKAGDTMRGWVGSSSSSTGSSAAAASGVMTMTTTVVWGYVHVRTSLDKLIIPVEVDVVREKERVSSQQPPPTITKQQQKEQQQQQKQQQQQQKQQRLANEAEALDRKGIQWLVDLGIIDKDDSSSLSDDSSSSSPTDDSNNHGGASTLSSSPSRYTLTAQPKTVDFGTITTEENAMSTNSSIDIALTNHIEVPMKIVEVSIKPLANIKGSMKKPTKGGKSGTAESSERVILNDEDEDGDGGGDDDNNDDDNDDVSSRHKSPAANALSWKLISHPTKSSPYSPGDPPNKSIIIPAYNHHGPAITLKCITNPPIEGQPFHNGPQRQWGIITIEAIMLDRERGRVSVDIPYVATAVPGRLSWDANQLFFEMKASKKRKKKNTKQKPLLTREVNVTNSFPVALTLHSISLDDTCSEFFTLSPLSLPITILQSQTFPPIRLSYHPPFLSSLHNLTHPTITCHLILHTQVNDHTLPITIHSSTLHVTTPPSQPIPPLCHSSRDVRDGCESWWETSPAAKRLRLSRATKGRPSQRKISNEDFDLFFSKRPPSDHRRPVVLSFGAIHASDVKTRSFHVRNWNPHPMRLTAERRSLKGVELSLGRSPTHILDYLPSEQKKQPTTKMTATKIMPQGGNTVGNTETVDNAKGQTIRKFLERGQSFLPDLCWRNDVTMMEDIISDSNSPNNVEGSVLEELYQTYGKIELWKEERQKSESVFFEEVTERSEAPSLSDDDDDTTTNSLLMSLDGRKRYRLDDESETTTKKSTWEIPPGAVARFDVRVRAPPKEVLDRDITSFVATGLELTTDGERVPLVLVYEALLGTLKLGFGDKVDYRENKTKTPEGVLRVEPTFRIMGYNNETTTTGLVELSTDDGHNVPIYLDSSFTNNFALEELESCNRWFTIKLNGTFHEENTAGNGGCAGATMARGSGSGNQNDRQQRRDDCDTDDISKNGSLRHFRFEDDEDDENHKISYHQSRTNSTPSVTIAAKSKKVLVGHLFSTISCPIEQTNFYACALEWLENREHYQPSDCGLKAPDITNLSDKSKLKQAITNMREAAEHLSTRYKEFTDPSAKSPPKYKFSSMESDDDDDDDEINSDIITLSYDGSEDEKLNTLGATTVFYKTLRNIAMLHPEHQKDAIHARKNGRPPNSVMLLSSFTLRKFKYASDAWDDIASLGLSELSTNLRAKTTYPSSSSSHPLTIPIPRLSIRSTLTLPTLSQHSTVTFPPTHIGSTSEAYIPIINPTAHPIRIKITAEESTSLSSYNTPHSPLLFIQDTPRMTHPWWTGGHYWISDNEGRLSRSGHNVTITSGGGAFVSLVNPSLHAVGAFVLGCGMGCGLRNEAQEGRGSAPPWGASAVEGVVLGGEESVKEDVGSDGPNTEGESSVNEKIVPNFGIGWGGLGEVEVPGFGKAMLGPVYFRPSGRGEMTAGIYLENSVTGLERVELKGVGRWERLSFWEMEDTLNKMDRFGSVELRMGHPTLVFSGSADSSGRSVIQSVLVVNEGDVTIDISNVYMGTAQLFHFTNIKPHPNKRTMKEMQARRHSCEERGFRLVGCRRDLWANAANPNPDRSIIAFVYQQILDWFINPSKKPSHHSAEEGNASSQDENLDENLSSGFTLHPGENKTLQIEHYPDCTFRTTYASVNLEFQGRRNRGKWEKEFKRRKTELLVGYDMTWNEMTLCQPFRGRSPRSFFFNAKTAASSEDVPRKQYHWSFERVSITLLLFFFLFNTMYWFFYRHVNSSLFRSKLFYSSSDNTTTSDEPSPPSENNDRSSWSYATAFRCLARSDPTSAELIYLGKEQTKQILLNRYKKQNLIPPSCVQSNGEFCRERIGVSSLSSGPNTVNRQVIVDGGDKTTGGVVNTTTAQGGAAEHGKSNNRRGGDRSGVYMTMTDAIFGRCHNDDDNNRGYYVPEGLGWRVAVGRNILKEGRDVSIALTVGVGADGERQKSKVGQLLYERMKAREVSASAQSSSRANRVVNVTLAKRTEESNDSDNDDDDIVTVEVDEIDDKEMDVSGNNNDDNDGILQGTHRRNKADFSKSSRHRVVSSSSSRHNDTHQTVVSKQLTSKPSHRDYASRIVPNVSSHTEPTTTTSSSYGDSNGGKQQRGSYKASVATTTLDGKKVKGSKKGAVSVLSSKDRSSAARERMKGMLLSGHGGDGGIQKLQQQQHVPNVWKTKKEKREQRVLKPDTHFINNPTTISTDTNTYKTPSYQHIIERTKKTSTTSSHIKQLGPQLTPSTYNKKLANSSSIDDKNNGRKLYHEIPPSNHHNQQPGSPRSSSSSETNASRVSSLSLSDGGTMLSSPPSSPMLGLISASSSPKKNSVSSNHDDDDDDDYDDVKDTNDKDVMNNFLPSLPMETEDTLNDRDDDDNNSKLSVSSSEKKPPQSSPFITTATASMLPTTINNRHTISSTATNVTSVNSNTPEGGIRPPPGLPPPPGFAMENVKSNDTEESEYSLFSYLPSINDGYDTVTGGYNGFDDNNRKESPSRSLTAALPIQSLLSAEERQQQTTTSNDGIKRMEQDILIGISPLLQDHSPNLIVGQPTESQGAVSAIGSAIGSGARNTISTSLGTELRMSTDSINSDIPLFGFHNSFNVEGFLDGILNDSTVEDVVDEVEVAGREIKKGDVWDASSGEVLIPTENKRDVSHAVPYGIPVGGSVIGGERLSTLNEQSFAVSSQPITRNGSMSLVAPAEFPATAAPYNASGDISTDGPSSSTLQNNDESYNLDEFLGSDPFLASLVGELK